MTVVLLFLVMLLLMSLPAVHLGTDRKSGKRVYLPLESFRTHYHLIGGTGKGKTTALEAIQHQLFVDPLSPACHIVVDRMGSYSYSLLAWFASPWCPEWVRRRLVYIEGANERVVCPFNPLTYDTPGHGYFKTARATDVVLRAWSSQNIEETPRLARWIFNAFWSAAQLGLTIADCVHLLMPGSDLHGALLRLLPPLLQAEWREILQARGEAGKMLEAPRNRLKPFFESPILRSIFGSTRNHLDVLRFMREARIVVVNLAPQNRLSAQVSDAFGGLLLNELLAVARSLPMGVRYPTYVWLDEFQRFVGPDMAEAIPEVRQMGLRFVCSHQSLSQLERGETDLRELAYQLQSRMIFGVQGKDADELAHELASITYRDRWVKDEMKSLRQIQTGHEVKILGAWSRAEAEAKNWSDTYGSNWSQAQGDSTTEGWQRSDTKNQGTSYRQNEPFHPTLSQGSAHADGQSGGNTKTSSRSDGGSASTTKGGSSTKTNTESAHEQLVPVLHTFEEVTRRSFYDFNEQAVLWGQSIRNQARGQCCLRLVDDPLVHEVDVERHAPGYLAFDLDTLRQRLPQAIDAVKALIEDNFKSDLFVTPEEIERETKLRLERVLHPVIELRDRPALEAKAEQPVVIDVPNPGSAYGY